MLWCQAMALMHLRQQETPFTFYHGTVAYARNVITAIRLPVSRLTSPLPPSPLPPIPYPLMKRTSSGGNLADSKLFDVAPTPYVYMPAQLEHDTSGKTISLEPASEFRVSYLSLVLRQTGTMCASCAP